MFIANIRYSRIDAISLNGQYHTVVFSNHENATGISKPIALDLDTVNGYHFIENDQALKIIYSLLFLVMFIGLILVVDRFH